MRIAVQPTGGNDRQPQYVAALLRSLHQLNQDRRSLTLEIGSGTGRPGLFVEAPLQLRDLFLGELRDAYPSSTVEVVRSHGRGAMTTSVSLRLVPDAFCIRTFRAFEESSDRDFADPIAGLLSAVRTGRSQRVAASIRLTLKPARRSHQRAARRICRWLTSDWSSPTLRRCYGNWSSSGSFLLRWLATALPWFVARKSRSEYGGCKLNQHLFECWLTIDVETPKDASRIADQKLLELRAALARFTSEEAWFRRCRKGGRGFLMSAEEVATLWHPSVSSVKAARMARAAVREVEPPIRLPHPNERGVTEVGRVLFRQQRDRFGIRPDDLRRHMIAIGKTGCGKSTFLLNMVTQQIAMGRGVVLIDPHGQLADEVFARVASHRTNDVVVFDAGADSLVQFNPLVGPRGCDSALVADAVLTAFSKVFGFDAASAPRMQHIFRNCLLSLIGTRHASLSSVQRLLVDAGFRREIVPTLKNDAVREFWRSEFERWSDRDRTQYIASLQNKLGAFTTNERLQRTVGGNQRGLDLRTVLDESKVLICNLSKGRVGHDASTLLGSLLLSMIQLAAMSRADVAESERPDATIVVDEFHSYLAEGNSTLADALAESRKYRTSYVLAAQMLDQLDSQTRAAIMGNCGSVLCMTVGPRDAEVLAELLGGDVTPTDLMQLPKYHAYLRLLVDGSPHSFSMTTRPASRACRKRADIVRRVSQQRYAPRNSREIRVTA